MRVAGELAACPEPEDEPFPEDFLESLRALIGGKTAGFSELDRIGERVLGGLRVGDGDGDDPGEEVFWALRHEWPTCAYEDRTLDFGAHKLSDFIATRELRRRQIYNDLFRAWKVEYEISVGLPSPLTHTKIFLFFNDRQGGDFGERERTILELLRPHFVRRYAHVQLQQRVEAALAALETSDQPLVMLDAFGRSDFATPHARRLLARYGFDANDIPNVDPLIVRAVRSDVVLLEEQRPLGLTRREREILGLVTQGYTNAQVARALWISPATVAKHLENAYAKLGVATRTAAVRMIQEHGIAG